MTMRTRKKTVTFVRPFILGALDDMLPAGNYLVETDEMLLEDVSVTAFRRVSTLLHLHANPRRPGFSQVLEIDPSELDAALLRDRAPASAEDVEAQDGPAARS